MKTPQHPCSVPPQRPTPPRPPLALLHAECPLLPCFNLTTLPPPGAGKPAFRGASMEQLKLRIMRVSHEPFAPTTTTGAKSLVRELLQQSVEGRATARDCAMHSWLPSYSI